MQPSNQPLPFGRGSDRRAQDSTTENAIALGGQSQLVRGRSGATRTGLEPYNANVMFIRTTRIGLACAMLSGMLLSVGAARGDVFHLKGGDTIEGEVLEDLSDAYHVRTLVGIAVVEKDRVVRREKGPSPWRLYIQKRRKTPHTAQGHYELAQWCRKHGLRPEATDHLKQVIRLDPDHAKARKALGYVKEKGKWRRPRSPKAPTDEELAARRAAKAEERLLRKLVSEWFVKIKSIHRGRMAKQKAGMRSSKFRKAREQLLAIRDPLAIPGLAGVLSTGPIASRRVLVEALAQFDEDEATMNLVAMALLDPSRDIRGLAALELIPRDDDRVVRHLRDALASERERILRNAATALGVLKARSAVEDLVAALSTETAGRVRISQPVYFDGIRGTFGGGCRHVCDGRLRYYRPTSIGVFGPGSMVGTATRYEDRPVSVYRTEVQEALIAITGQNFGFDADAWLAWWQQNGA